LLQPLDDPSRNMKTMRPMLRNLWSDQRGQGVAEYAIMLVVVLTLALGAIRAIGSHSNELFRSIVSAIE
jgi:Flp pilus assembly pilin Flp